MVVNCSVFCDVRSSILGQNVMFGKIDVQIFNVLVFEVLYFGIRSKTSPAKAQENCKCKKSSIY